MFLDIQNGKELAKTIRLHCSLKQNETAFTFDDPAKFVIDASDETNAKHTDKSVNFHSSTDDPPPTDFQQRYIVIQVNQPSLTTIASHMVNNSENSQRQRVNDPRRNVARSADHERGNARQIRGFRAFGSSPGLGIPSPLWRGGTDGRATFFKIKFTARSNGDDPFRRRGARRLSSGRRWCRCSLRPGSSTSSSLSHRLFHPTFRFLLLPSRYRVTEFAILPEAVSALDPLPKFFLTNLTVFFLLALSPLPKVNYFSS